MRSSFNAAGPPDHPGSDPYQRTQRNSIRVGSTASGPGKTLAWKIPRTRAYQNGPFGRRPDTSLSSLDKTITLHFPACEIFSSLPSRMSCLTCSISRPRRMSYVVKLKVAVACGYIRLCSMSTFDDSSREYSGSSLAAAVPSKRASMCDLSFGMKSYKNHQRWTNFLEEREQTLNAGSPS